MAVGNYEAMLVFSVKESEDAAKALVEKFKALIEKNGTVESVDECASADLHTKSTTRQKATMLFTTSMLSRNSRQSSTVSSTLRTVCFVHL